MADKQPLNDEQYEELEQVFNFIQEHQDKLNEWEVNFIADNVHRFQQYGKQTYFSERQLQVIQKIYAKCEDK